MSDEGPDNEYRRAQGMDRIMMDGGEGLPMLDFSLTDPTLTIEGDLNVQGEAEQALYHRLPGYLKAALERALERFPGETITVRLAPATVLSRFHPLLIAIVQMLVEHACSNNQRVHIDYAVSPFTPADLAGQLKNALPSKRLEPKCDPSRISFQEHP